MKCIPYFVLLIAASTVSRQSIYSDVKDNVLNFLQKSLLTGKDEPELDSQRERKKNLLDAKTAKSKASVVENARNIKNLRHGPDINHIKDENLGRQMFHMDPVLNFLARRSYRSKNIRNDSSGTSSSSMELQDWKDEWREHWIQKKFEAINSSVPKGDSVNMLAARPWGVPCGDPNQHDMPWGSCMLPMECEPEYRVYRGDYFCGRTQFVCCALQLTAYDMYQGFDVSFDRSSLETSSEEKRNRQRGSKERKRAKKRRERKRRLRARYKRKRKIKRNIRNIVKEIRKILSRSYRNGSTLRKKKTKQLKRFVKNLKKQYKKDRKSVKGIHEVEMIKIDEALQRKLDQIKGVNRQFIRNQTFRDIVVNGTVSPAAVKMLVGAYPEILNMLDRTRRANDDKPDYLDYDIEYGLLYY